MGIQSRKIIDAQCDRCEKSRSIEVSDSGHRQLDDLGYRRVRVVIGPVSDDSPQEPQQEADLIVCQDCMRELQNDLRIPWPEDEVNRQLLKIKQDMKGS